MNAPRRLGRGLGGLLQSTVADPTAGEIRDKESIPTDQIRPNPFQPRRAFDEAALADLRESIAKHGVLQPIVVRRGPLGYEVIAGERRLRAAKALGMATIPAVVREADDFAMQTLALVENLQREDLNALEKAKALKAMMVGQNLTHEEVAARIGKDRTTITNFVRLLELPEEVKVLLEAGGLTAGQARAILQAPTEAKRLAIARLAVERDLSVREVERLAKQSAASRTNADGKTNVGGGADPFLRDIESRLRAALSAKVTLHPRGGGGEIRIHYHDGVQLDAVTERICK